MTDMNPTETRPVSSGNESQLADYNARLIAAGLQRHAAALTALARPSVRLTPIASEDADLPLGTSKLGGQPDLPAATAWPSLRTTPLAFVAQINLAETQPFDTASMLPVDGLLSFFYAAAGQQVWGYDPADAGAWAVLYSPAGQPLIRRNQPGRLPEHVRFAAMRLTRRCELTFPGWDSLDAERVGMTRDEFDAYADLCGHGEQGPIHRLLGRPEPIQNDMQMECQLVTHGIYCGDETDEEDPRAAGLWAGAADWRLLLQIDSEKDIGMMWGDAGRLYFWMTEQALADRDWDRAWLVLQCS